MDEGLGDILNSRFNKDLFFKTVNESNETFNEAVEIACGDQNPQSWRAAWVLNHVINKNDHRITPYVKRFTEILLDKNDGHQRELLKILLQLELNEDDEGLLFDKCVTIWEDISKSPSVRMVAFKALAKIASQYPEMKNEISFLVEDHYLESLSPGIKNSLLREIKKLEKNKT